MSLSPGTGETLVLSQVSVLSCNPKNQSFPSHLALGFVSPLTWLGFAASVGVALNSPSRKGRGSGAQSPRPAAGTRRPGSQWALVGKGKGSSGSGWGLKPTNNKQAKEAKPLRKLKFKL